MVRGGVVVLIAVGALLGSIFSELSSGFAVVASRAGLLAALLLCLAFATRAFRSCQRSA